MTTATDELRLAADFPKATREDWRKLVDGVLKGAPFEKLVGKTYDGLKIDPIYGRARDAEPMIGRAAATPWRCTTSRTAPTVLNSSSGAGPAHAALALPTRPRKP